MPAPELNARYQIAVLWTRKGTDGSGQPTLNDPIEITVRWNTVKREVTGPQGAPIAITAEVVVDRAVANGSMMWLGTLDDLPGTALLPEEDVMTVVSCSETKDIKARFVQRTLSLARAKDVLYGEN